MRQSFKYVCLGILIALPLLFMGENQFSYANQESNFEQEIQNAIEAQETMDESSKQQMIASMILFPQNTTITDIKGIDLETALLLVQSQRSNLLDQQLKAQLEEIRLRNEQMEKLNRMINQLKTIRDSINNSNSRQEIDLKNVPNFDIEEFKKNISTTQGGSLNSTNVTKESIGMYIEMLTDKIESMSNTQQMDMLRLQSLSNKKNEAFEVMSNFIKQMNESRSGIISNMR